MSLRRLGVRRDRALERLPRVGQPRGIEVDGADVLVRHRVARIDLEALRKRRQRVLLASAARVRNAERIERVERRVGRDRALQQLDRRRVPTRFAEIRPELNLRARRRPARAKRRAQRVDRARQIADAPEVEREMAGGRHHVGPLGQDLPIARDPFVQLPFIVERDRFVHEAIDADEPLGIVPLGIAILRRRRSRHVAERTQPRGNLSRFRLARPWTSRMKVAEPRAQRAHALRRCAREIVRFAAIARQVVQLRQRQVDVLLAADHHAVERGEPEVEHRLHRLEIRCARGAPVAIRRPAQRVARKFRRHGHRERVENRRHDVDVPHRRVRHDRITVRLEPDTTYFSDDERHVQR